MSSREQQLRQGFFAALLLLVVSLSGVTAFTLWQLRVDAIKGGLQMSAMHTRSFEDFLTQNLHVTELVGDNFDIQAAATSKDHPANAHFVDFLRHAPFLRSMSLLDERGRIFASSNPANIGLGISMQDFLPPAPLRSEILRIGRPWEGRDFSDGRETTPQTAADPNEHSFIPAARDLLVGKRHVTLLFAINPDYFSNHVMQKLGPEEGSVQVLRYDGTVLIDSALATRAGMQLNHLLQAFRLPEREHGEYASSDRDKQAILTSFRASSLYPVVVVTHLQQARVLLPWWTSAKTLLAVAGSSLLLIIALSITYYRRQMQIAEQRSEVERQQGINAKVFETSSDAIVITDADSRIISINPSFTRITGYSKADALGQNPVDLLSSHHQDAAFYVQMWGEVLGKGFWHGEVVNRHKGGSLYDLSLSVAVSRNRNGEPEHFIAVGNDITERKRAEQALKHESEKNRALLHNGSDGIHILDEHGNVMEASEAFCSMLGYTRDEVIGMNVSQWDASMDSTEIRMALRRQFEYKGRSEFESKHRRKDGSVFDVEISGIPLLLDGKPVLFNSSRDISARKQAEAELHIAATAFETQDGIMVTDAEGNILRVNKAFSEITGYEPEQVVGQNPRILKSGRHDAVFYSAMWHAIKTHGSWSGEIWNRRRSGEIYPERLTITALKDEHGKLVNYVASVTDITLHKAAENEIRSLAFYDPLTGLPNRRLMLDRLQQALSSCGRSKKFGAVLFLDLDNFKSLNDTLGHDKGDLLLQEVARRLELCIRKGDTVARLGGDEFVVMLEDLSPHALEAASQTEGVGEKIMEMLNKPYQLGHHEYHNSPSIGATLFSEGRDSIDELIKQADIAMYQAKKAGRNTLRFFDPQMQESLNAKASLEDDLRKSLTRAQFSLYYQVQVDENYRPFGAEALIRWIHPERGLVSPDHFIPLAEETGLILPIGEWVLENACAQLKAWEDTPLTSGLCLSINVSAKQFHQAGFVTQVSDAIRHHAVDPGKLELELTESMLLENVDETIATMEALKQLGIKLSLDDFGTGYSSLQYLKRLPLDQFKIDKSFIRDIAVSSSDRAIVQSVIAMAHSLELDVIAEGVETQTQCDLLMKHGCPHYQGYLFSKPVPIAQFEASLSSFTQD
ncbi:MAG: EAL domain-containing protein [Gammaproteobacteria bacterium]|nr:EAL domain-containing protein [Gammaproteobacteria bacterium]MBU1624066.1 EAL domain-containing protein [Gammaproteobacteria bacterium]MBU1981794.1 EAL domain-containing protein [Gammaproteobacteria bacterium]